ncbi:hypothetical protein NLU66_05595 [Brachybacterium sp. NBEC-018]|uniref:hypothetical protein n=1 Tax=Brachybacterium sp. NBEC-018 TaxID=2996004 RepID=UPI0021753CCB|nr:hypothetical protein [Brachybacterium sp. NBEC-018]UVY85073.1 hypothetical protein NLU66_05595 [Brachybacterium sp. NBEC-018]
MNEQVIPDGGKAPEGVETEDPFQRLGVLTAGASLKAREGDLLRFDLLVGTVVVPALLRVHPDFPEKLLVAFNGAVARRATKSPLETFQRRTWVDDFRGSALFIADPTLQPHNRISIGWGQGTEGAFALPAMAATAQFVARELGIASSKRLYYGSSAGGFQALQVAARDAGSQVLVNNAQIDWTRYFTPYVNTICSHAFGGKTPEEITEQTPHRVSVVDAFAEFDHVPQVRYLLNTGSQNDLALQAPALLERLGRVAGAAAVPRIEVAAYYDKKAGHMPLSRPRSVREVNRALDSLE